jgi:hypothetical protein
MPIQTDLSVAPYFDDYNETKSYYQILFKPGVALQTRELNQLQTILQNQIERFGDNIFVKGTIINGCNFTYDNAYPYVKILDLQVDGQPVNVGAYINLRAVSSSNLISVILGANTGYVSQSPDLSTLFLRYLNSGNTYTQTAYNANDVLTIYNVNNTIYQVNVPVGGSGAGLSNNDTLVFMSAITVPSNASVIVNDTINDPVSKANATVVAVNSTAVANSIVLSLAPYANALTNNSVNSTAWTFNLGNTVLINNTTGTTITSIIGSAATGQIITNGIGTITQVAMLTNGGGYTYAPYVTVKTTNTSANVSSLGLTAQNYLARVTIANNAAAGSSNAVGLGYAFSVSEGIVYQKGHFLYVAPQTTVVSKYSTTPDQLSVGFNTAESIINSDIDPSLLDNSTGTLNSLAPGADRLKLVPSLSVVSTTDTVGNSDFFAITAFSLGQPYLQNQQTSYSTINNEMALRTYETNGDFVVDPFLLESTSPKDADANTEAAYFTAVVDPGEAYISGHRVKTYTNYSFNVAQGTDTNVANATSVVLNYDNSITVDDLGGSFNFTTGDYVTFYDTAKNFLSNTTTACYANSNTTPLGTSIGTGRIRSFSLKNGTPGTPSAQYSLYLYDINMNPSTNFRNVQSIYYVNGANAAIADVVGTYDAISNSTVAIIANTSSSLLFSHGTNATSATANSYYVFRDVQAITTNGIIQVSVTGTNYFPYANGTNLTDAQENDIHVVFTSNSASVNVADVLVVNTSSNLAIANTTAYSNGNFLTKYYAGDYIEVFQSGGTIDVRRISAVVNATALQLDRVCSDANGISNAAIFFPKNVPVPLSKRLDRYSNVSSSGQTLTVDLGVTLTSPTSPVSVMYNTLAAASTYVPKTTNRNTSVVIQPVKNLGGLAGPWALGHPDIFRLRKVYLDTATNIINTTANVALVTFNANQVGGTFSNGEVVYKYNGSVTLNISANTGVFSVGDEVYQANATTVLAQGTVYSVNTTVMVVNTDPSIIPEFVAASNTIVKYGTTTTNAVVSAVALNNANLGVITYVSSAFNSVINNVVQGNVISIQISTNNSSAISTIYDNSKLVGTSSTANGIVLASYNNLQTVVGSIPATALDVTNDFYIDHKQNLDYLDYGYLYKNPKSSLTIDSNTGLIAYFDHFTQASTGFVTKSSYPVDDSKSLAELTSVLTGGSVHTLEIPELTTQMGNTYDLINKVDFRPRVVATANITANTLVNSTVNPLVLPTTTKFATNAHINFPVPGSTYTSDITQYLGRIDRVVIDNNGTISSIKGNPSVNNLTAPRLPSNTISVNLINIPPYPSLPKVLSNNYISILDKNLVNEGVNEQRVISHTVGIPNLTPEQQEVSQPVRYTMSDIANLEARIKALEYYVALSQLEQSVAGAAVPSSINPSVNRFKYGFFADNFDDDFYTDKTNPQHTTIIDDNHEVVPGKFMKNISVDVNLSNASSSNCVTGDYVTLPYRYANGLASVTTLVSQGVATATAQAGVVVTNPIGIMTCVPATFTIETTVKVANTTPPAPKYTTLLAEVGTAHIDVIQGGYNFSLLGSLFTTPTNTIKQATQYGEGPKTFTVPAGVYSLLVYAWGAGGGGGGGDNVNTTNGVAGGAGGSGGFVTAYVKVTPGQTIKVFAGTGGGAGTVGGGNQGSNPTGYLDIPGATVHPKGTGGTGGGGGAASGVIVNGTLMLWAGGGGGGAGASFHRSGSPMGSPGGTGGGTSTSTYSGWDPNSFTSPNRNGIGGSHYFNGTYCTGTSFTDGAAGVLPTGGSARGTTNKYYIQLLGAGGGSVQKGNGLPGYHGKVVILY